MAHWLSGCVCTCRSQGSVHYIIKMNLIPVLKRVSPQVHNTCTSSLLQSPDEEAYEKSHHNGVMAIMIVGSHLIFRAATGSLLSTILHKWLTNIELWSLLHQNGGNLAWISNWHLYIGIAASHPLIAFEHLSQYIQKYLGQSVAVCEKQALR